ncbi:15919_t:CDS:2 [Entrophospora sp. SA101]|nr:15919_t:CDS:2 [Entrophospora sp. SA101]
MDADSGNGSSYYMKLQLAVVPHSGGCEHNFSYLILERLMGRTVKI